MENCYLCGDKFGNEKKSNICDYCGKPDLLGFMIHNNGESFCDNCLWLHYRINHEDSYKYRSYLQMIENDNKLLDKFKKLIKHSTIELEMFYTKLRNLINEQDFKQYEKYD